MKLVILKKSITPKNINTYDFEHLFSNIEIKILYNAMKRFFDDSYLEEELNVK